LTATLTAPAVKTAPATTVTGITVDGTAATASAVTWSANTTSANGFPAAGTGAYTAKFDITAPDGVTFTEGQAFSITIDGATSARAVYKDANTASVTAVFPAITKTAESITATAPTTSVEVGDSYEVKYAPITITYNDGSTQTVDASSASYASSGITVDTSALTGGNKGTTSLTIAGADKGKTLNVTALLGTLSAVIEKVKVTENAPPAGGSEVYAVYDNGTLTFKYDDPAEETGTVYTNILNINQTSAANLPWNANRNSITKVVFDRSFGYAYPTDTSYWFANCANLETIEGIGHLITKDTTNMSNMFAGCENLTAPDLSTLDTGKVTDMSGMFKDCTGFTDLDVSKLDTKAVTDMTSMFEGCTGITELDVSEWKTTVLTTADNMFKDCTALKTIYADEAADWTGITSGTDMFDGCSALKGGNGTAYSAEHKDKSYAIVDSKTQKGYFTATKMVSGTYAVYDGDKTCTFKYSEEPVRERGTIFDAANTTTNEPWLDINSKVEKVIFDDSF
ncbi:MAG: BspA family leucine-rich repeat surface protein, partial [Clostridia bacterium]|nr:BspA family leucine-rich repeat surface protein [Clostridia bacterium]